MATLLSEFTNAVTPTPADARMAQESSRSLARLLGARKKHVQFRIQPDDKPDAIIAIPPPALATSSEPVHRSIRRLRALPGSAPEPADVPGAHRLVPCQVVSCVSLLRCAASARRVTQLRISALLLVLSPVYGACPAERVL